MNFAKLSRRHKQANLPKPHSSRLFLESLEDRLLLSVDLTHGPIGFDNGTPEVGEVINIMTDIYNIGDETLTDDFYVDFVANGTSLTNGQGFLITTDIPAGGKITIPKAYTYQGSFPDIEVKIDINDDVIEVAENNNSYTESFLIPKADLAITSLTHSTNTNIKGDQITYTATVQNLGPGGTVRDCDLHWYINRGTGWTYIESDRITNDFLVDDLSISESETFTLTLDYDVTEIKAVVDSNNEVNEINEWNNEAFDVISVDHPDLIVSDIFWSPENPMDGQQVSFYAIIDNIGEGGTTENFSVNFIVDYGLDSEQDLGSTRVYNTITPFDITDPSSSFIAQVSKGTWTASPGNHTITVIIDSGNEIAETTMLNNASSMLAGQGEIGIEILDGFIRDNGDTTEMVFPVTLSQPIGNTASVYYMTHNLSAVAGEEFQRTSGILEFAPYETSAEIVIPLLDYDLSTDKEFVVVIGGANYASLINRFAYGILTDNTTPEAIDDTYQVECGHSLVVSASYGLLANDNDADGDALTITNTGIITTTYGQVTLASDGSFTYTPDSNYIGEDSFSYTITDSVRHSYATATAYITLTEENQAPITNSDIYIVSETGILQISSENGLLANDIDPEGQPLSITSAGQYDTKHGSITIAADGSFVYTPNEGWTGTEVITLDNGGLFTEEVQVIFYDRYVSTSSVHSADMDNDGDMDILALKYQDGADNLIWYENIGNGEFGTEEILITLSASIDTSLCQMFVEHLQAIDIDNDGDMDIVAQLAIEDTIGDDDIYYYDLLTVSYENIGNNIFSSQNIITQYHNLTNESPSFPYTETHSGNGNLVFADIDNDGDVDILSVITHYTYGANKYGGALDDIYTYNIVWYKNNGKGKYSSKKTIEPLVGDYTSDFSNICVADMDNDGHMDILMGTSSAISWYKNNGKEKFSLQQTISAGDYSDCFILTGNVDNDGDMDIIMNHQNTLWIYKNNGLGYFSEYQSGGNAGGNRLVDMDNDGDMDIASSSAWYENDGNGNFNFVDQHTLPGTCLDIADINNDGEPDLLINNNKEISWFENIPKIPCSISDDRGQESPSTLTIITPMTANTPLTVIPSVVTDTGIQQITGDTDEANVSLISYQQPTHGTVTMENGSLHYTSEFGYTGPDSFSYILRDMQDNDVPLTAYIQVDYGRKISVTKKTPYTYTDSNQQQVTVKVGSGTAMLYFIDDSNSDIGKMLVNADVNSVKIITSKNSTTTVQEIDLQANLKYFKAPGLIVDGTGIYGSGSSASIILADIVNDADIILEGTDNKPSKVQLNQLGDNDGLVNTLQLAAGIKSAKVNSMSPDSAIVTTELGGLSSKSTIQGDITVTGINPVKYLKAKSSITNGIWQINGDIGSVSAKQEIMNIHISNVANIKSIYALSINGLDIQSEGLIKSLKTKNDMINSNVYAEEIGSIKTKTGLKDTAISSEGNIKSVSSGEIDGLDVQSEGLIKSLSVKGDIINSHIYSEEIGTIKTKTWLKNTAIFSKGNIKSVASGGIDGLDLVAGVDSFDDPLATIPQIDLNNNATINKLKISGKVTNTDQISTFNSVIAAGAITTAYLGTVDLIGDDRLMIGAITGQWNPQKIKIKHPNDRSIKYLYALANAVVEPGQNIEWYQIEVI